MNDHPGNMVTCSRVALIGAECEESLPLRYLAASLGAAGFEVVLIAFDSISDMESAARELAEGGAQLAGFSMVFTSRAHEFALLARHARDLGYVGHIVAGGHFAAFNADSLLRDEPCFDSVAIGEGERLIVELARGLDDLHSVGNLVWRDRDGNIVRNERVGPVEDLDALPRPVRRKPPDQYLGLPIANMLSSRGCTHACRFCSIAAWHKLGGGARFRMRSPVDVADEMADLYSDGYRLFNFHDDNFLLGTTARNLERVDAIGNGLAARHVGPIGLAIKSRPDSVNALLFSRLKDMGLFRVFLGIEAGTEDALVNLGRRQTVQQNERALEVLNGLDLHVCFNLLLFNPASTLEDFAANVRFMQRHPVNPMNFCRTEVYSGTPLEAALRDEGRIEGSYWGYGYHIHDPRAQLAFELMHHTLFDRHHADENVHHLAMRVDYERQLLAQFHACSDDLRLRAKAFVRDVNLRSVGFLLRIAELAGAGITPRGDQADALRRDNRADIEALERRAQVLLDEIRQAAWRANQGGGPSFVRLGVGVAASLLLVAGSQAAIGQQECEMVVAPLEQPVKPPPASTATNVSARPGQPPDGDIKSIAAYVNSFSQVLARHMDKPKTVEVEIWLDKDGRISFAAVYKAGQARNAGGPELSKQDSEKADKLLKNLGADSFSAREKATRDLIKMGAPVLAATRAYKGGQNDPEVVQRCNQVISAVDIVADMTDYEGAVGELKAINLSIGSDCWGRRYVVEVSEELLRRWKNRRPFGGHTHIFERAAAPLD